MPSNQSGAAHINTSLVIITLIQSWPHLGHHALPNELLYMGRNLCHQSSCLCVFLCVLGDVIHGYMEGESGRWSG